ncbi:hypothetical protein Krac_10645 [Ktedonobacter racemifer DSM 44963]|uniref:Uncharacterized protein n=1 Tax=Ktedonobacter racemifer DSM 44963 TaxID=485913 RepID=D6TI59_KTERA|nr:hypothetical protein Krac_10645 [Ktedonobacter racemifer DSM 44963]
MLLLPASLECGLAALPSNAVSLPWPGSLQDDKKSMSNRHGNAGLVPGLHVLGETEKLQEGRRFSAVTSTPPEPGMNPREGDLLEVVYWKALVISWHLRLSLLDTEPDPKDFTCQQSLDRQNQSVWGSKGAPFFSCT